MSTVEGTREYLLKYNIKPSLQRMAIMDYLMAHRVHPTADEIYNALYPTMPTLSKTTIYNTMKLFTEQGAVKVLAHFMCLGCGCVYDLPVENQDAIQLEGVGELIITEIHLYYKGYCKKCAEEKRKNILL